MTETTMSEYELQRLRNIERNHARLRQLGLLSTLEKENEKSANHENATNNHSKNNDENHSNDNSSKHKKRACKSKSTLSGNDHEAKVPQRKSRRIQGLKPTNAPENARTMMDSSCQLLLDDDSGTQRIPEERPTRCWPRVLGELAAATEQTNPTATYDHCRRRVQTMTEPALANRIRVIERAAGKHAVVKMAIFQDCLQDAGLLDLAQAAAEALQRLQTLQPPPPPPPPRR
ncbi:hypothetical protein ACA910_015931 [Epithemia clementina (nom. ined.)]